MISPLKGMQKFQAESRDRPGRESRSSSPLPCTGWLKGVYLTLAAFFFMLAALGAVLPGLPSTPFLLLTSFFTVRSSPSLHRRLRKSRWFGTLLLDWEMHGGVRREVKVKAILMIVFAVGLSLWLLQRSLRSAWVIVALASVGIFVIMRVPTICSNRASLTDVGKH